MQHHESEAKGINMIHAVLGPKKRIRKKANFFLQVGHCMRERGVSGASCLVIRAQMGC